MRPATLSSRDEEIERRAQFLGRLLVRLVVIMDDGRRMGELAFVDEGMAVEVIERFVDLVIGPNPIHRERGTSAED